MFVADEAFKMLQVAHQLILRYLKKKKKQAAVKQELKCLLTSWKGPRLKPSKSSYLHLLLYMQNTKDLTQEKTLLSCCQANYLDQIAMKKYHSYNNTKPELHFVLRLQAPQGSNSLLIFCVTQGSL